MSVKGFILTDHQPSAKTEVAMYCPEMLPLLGKEVILISKIPVILDPDRPWTRITFDEETHTKEYRDLLTFFTVNFSGNEYEDVVDFFEHIEDA